MKQALVIYHNKDNDGFCSGAITCKELTDEGYNVELLGYDYKDPVPFIENKKIDRLMFVDVTFPLDDMLRLDHLFGQCMTIIDHHVSFNDAIMPHFTQLTCGYFYNNELSACELTWRYFNTDQIPPFVYAVGVWDIHRKENLNTYSFEDYQRIHFATDAMFNDITCNESICQWVEFIYNGTLSTIDDLRSVGGVIEQCEKKKGKLMSQSSFSVMTTGQRFNAFNGHPSKYTTIDNEHPLLFFWFDGPTQKFICSLRQNESFAKKPSDILRVAKLNGGGGHENACGFSLSKEDFFEGILKNNDISDLESILDK
jgi:oligoribonuclease NrnB/cAMP/cGMP phosphodiesterase (DHH superfamily)